MADIFNLQRFIDAQADTFDNAFNELSRGRKSSHWMWFIFPQLGALGHSVTARHYGIGSLEEAIAYYDHPVLGSRLRQCLDLLLASKISSPRVIFGSPDDLKLRSCLTLFAAAAPADSRFVQALTKFYPDGPDDKTRHLLAQR